MKRFLLLGSCLVCSLLAFADSYYDYIDDARRGDKIAQFNLGVCYDHGDGVQKDSKQAFYWWKKAAEQGMPEAQYLLGARYREGEGVQIDYKLAFYWFQKAADQGMAEAQNDLGVLYVNGKGTKKDIKQAFYWIQKAANQGMPEAQLNLAYFYRHGWGTSMDHDQAARWYRKAADQGYSDAQYELGNFYYKGLGSLSINYGTAVFWYRKAAEQGQVMAQRELANCYHDGKGVTQDDAQAFQWWQRSAEQGDSIAQFHIGECYQNGWAVTRNYYTANQWFRKSADKGCIEAMEALGSNYVDGFGCKENHKEAYKWLKKALLGDSDSQNWLSELGSYLFAHAGAYDLGRMYEKEGDAENALRYYNKAATFEDRAQYKLGTLYAQGKMVKKDDKEAFKWFHDAAKNGHIEAQVEVALRYKDGKGVAQDLNQAAEWFQKAADKDNTSAQFYLGALYDVGEGVEQNDVQAVHWYTKAADNNHPTAMALLGTYYLIGRGCLQDTNKGFSLLKKAADKGEVMAYTNLGYCYDEGLGTPVNYAQAFTWYKKAAELGEATAQANLGELYAQGRGVKQDYRKAFEWYKKAAEQGILEAQRELAKLYYTGQGVKRNYDESAHWFRKAADQDDNESAYYMGESHEFGRGVKQHDDAAAGWYLKLIEGDDNTMKDKAEKGLQRLSDKGHSPIAYKYIHSAYIHLIAENSDTEIFVKGPGEQNFTPCGRGKWDGSGQTGIWYVKSTRERWEDKVDTVSITHPATTQNLSTLKPKLGTLTIKSAPKNAVVYVDGTIAGTTPLCKELQIGQHDVRLTKNGRVDSETRNLTVRYRENTTSKFRLKSIWHHGPDDHPDHYLEPMYGLGLDTAGHIYSHMVGLRYGWIPKRFGLDISALYGLTGHEVSLTIGPTFRLTNFSCPLSLQLTLGGGGMYRFADNHYTWVADAALRFGFEGSGSDFGWWSFTLGTRYYDRHFVPTASVSLMPIRVLTLLAIEDEIDFPFLYTEYMNGYEFSSRQWMMGGRVDFDISHLGVGAEFMIGFNGGWAVMAGPNIRLTPDYVLVDLQLYQGLGYGRWSRSGFIGETGVRIAFGEELPAWGLWSLTLGCMYGSGNVGITFGVSLPIVSLVATGGTAALLYWPPF